MAKKPGEQNSDQELDDDLDDTSLEDSGDDTSNDDTSDDSEVEADGEEDLSSGNDTEDELADLIDKEFGGEKAKAQKDGKGKPAKDGKRDATRQDARSSSPQNDGAQLLQRYARTYLTSDAKGNLVDPATGKVVINAGRERYFFEQARHGRNQNAKLTQAFQKAVSVGRELQSQVQAFEKVNNSGLSMPEHTQAVQLFKSWKDNPAATLKYILTEAQANGTDLSAVLGKNGSGLDMGAIKQLIQSELKPVIEPQRQKQQRAQIERQIMERSAKEAEAFFEEFPDAAIHEQALADIITRFPSSSPYAAYAKLKDWVHKNGLDWNKPLAQQIAARQKGGSNQQSKRGLPPSRTMRRVEQEDEGGSLGANASSEDIVRQAMREANFNV